MSGEKAVTRQHLQDSLEAVLQALDAAGERLAAVEGDTPFLRTLAEAHELGAELLRWSKVHDDTAELVEALRHAHSALSTWASPADREGAREHVEAALARVKGGER